MPQTSIFKPDDEGYKGMFHTDQKTYKILKAVYTRTTDLFYEFSMMKWLSIPY